MNDIIDISFPISALVARYGVAAQSLRNWEQQGLIPQAHRTPGGHRRYGCEHIEALDRLLPREDSAVSALIADALRMEGIELVFGSQATRVSVANGRRTVHLDDGGEVSGQELLIAVGRAPRVADLGLDKLDINADMGGIKVDEHCRAAPNVWAIGDVTGAAGDHQSADPGPD